MNDAATPMSRKPACDTPERPIRRFGCRWLSAARLPKRIVAAAIAVRTGSRIHWIGAKIVRVSTSSTAKPAALDETARKAVTGVGAPW